MVGGAGGVLTPIRCQDFIDGELRWTMLADGWDELLGEVFRDSFSSFSAVASAAARADCFRSVSDEPDAFVFSEVEPWRFALSWYVFLTLISRMAAGVTKPADVDHHGGRF